MSGMCLVCERIHRKYLRNMHLLCKEVGFASPLIGRVIVQDGKIKMHYGAKDGVLVIYSEG